MFKLIIATLAINIVLFGAKPRTNAGPGDSVIPVIIEGGEWTTVIVFNNTNDLQVQFPLSFFNQDGPWDLPVKGFGTGSQFTITLAPRATLRMEFDSPDSGPLVGFGMIDVPCNFDPGTYCAGVGTYTLLRNHNSARNKTSKSHTNWGQPSLARRSNSCSTKPTSPRWC